MDSHSIGLMIVLAALIMMSAYFSATETAFSTFNRIKLKSLADGGNRRAKLALRLSENYDKQLSTILIGNNIVNIASASMATVLFVRFLGDIGVTVSTVVMTVLVLIFGEISPKSLAKEAPERFCMFSAPILNIFLKVLTPLNFIFMQWKKLLSKIVKVQSDRGISEQELLTLVDEAQQEGGLDPQESELIRSAIEFNDLEVDDILTPRVDETAVALDDSLEEIAAAFRESGHSRLPVYGEDIDEVVGILHQKDFYTEALEQGKPLSEVLQSALFVPAGMHISQLLKLLQQKKTHLAIVTDESGGNMGVVTMEDVLEELVGDIFDEHDEVSIEVEQLSPNSYRFAGNADLDDVCQVLGIPEEECDNNTLNGWLVEKLERIPKVGEEYRQGGLRFIVDQADARRVLKVRCIREEMKTA